MPTLGVTVAVIEDGRVLVTKRADFPAWCLPGGGVDAGESVAAAAVREVREETGLEVALTRLVGVYSRPRWRRGGAHEVLFAARPIGGEARPREEEVLELGFYAPDDLPEPFLWWHRQRVRHALDDAGAAAAWSQDAVWPFPQDMPYEELLALRDREPGLLRRLVAEFGRQPRPEDLRLEVGEMEGAG